MQDLSFIRRLASILSDSQNYDPLHERKLAIWTEKFCAPVNECVTKRKIANIPLLWTYWYGALVSANLIFLCYLIHIAGAFLYSPSKQRRAETRNLCGKTGLKLQLDTTLWFVVCRIMLPKNKLIFLFRT